MAKTQGTAEELTEIRSRIAEAQRTRDELVVEWARAVIAEMHEEPGAEARIDAIKTRSAALDGEIEELRRREAELQRHLAETAREKHQAEAEALPLRLAALGQLYLDTITQVERDLTAGAAGLRALISTASRLAIELNQEEARRLFTAGAVLQRVQSAFARLFTIDPTGELTPRNSLLGLAGGAVGARSWLGAADIENEILDDLSRYYLTREDADAARQRIAARDGGSPEAIEARARRLVIVELPGPAFALTDRVFGDLPSAEAAARQQPLSLVPHKRGFVAFIDRLVGRAA